MNVRTRPLAPIAGRTFTVLVPSIGLSTGQRVTPDTATCSATLASAPLRGRGSGRCSFRFPATAAGKKLRVTVTAGYRGATKKRAAVYTVRKA